MGTSSLARSPQDRLHDHYRALSESEWLRIKRAHARVAYALRTGRLVRPDSCAQCNRSCKPDAAHWDYDEPLNVRWLCRRCHHQADRAAPKWTSGLARFRREANSALKALANG